MANPTTINGIDTWPTYVIPQRLKIGSTDVNRAVDGTGYQKTVAVKYRLTLNYEAISAAEYAQVVAAFWGMAFNANGVPVVNADYGITSGSGNNNFLMKGDVLDFKPSEGKNGVPVWTGSLVLEEI